MNIFKDLYSTNTSHDLKNIIAQIFFVKSEENNKRIYQIN